MDFQEENTHSAARNSFVENLDPVRIQRLHTIVEDYQKQGRKKRYCILVDGEIVVPITSDPAHFDNYERYMLPSTRTVEVRMYFGASPKHNSHKFKASFSGLNGHENTNVNDRIEKAIEQNNQKHFIEKLQDRLKRKNKRIQELEDSCADLEEELEVSNEKIKQLEKNPMDYIKQSVEAIAMISQVRNPAKVTTPLAGGDTSVEVEVEDATQSIMDQEFANLKTVYSEKEILTAIKNWKDAMEYARKHKNQ